MTFKIYSELSYQIALQKIKHSISYGNKMLPHANKVEIVDQSGALITAYVGPRWQIQYLIKTINRYAFFLKKKVALSRKIYELSKCFNSIHPYVLKYIDEYKRLNSIVEAI